MQDRKQSCQQHGEYVSKNVLGHIWSKCPECARIDRERREREEKEKALKQQSEAWERAIGRAGIPERFNETELAGYVSVCQEQENALRRVYAYLEAIKAGKSGKSAIFSGNVGTGKTHLAIGVAKEMMRGGKSAVFITVQRLIRAVRDTWRRDSPESESDVIDKFARPDLLILDEVGVQAGSENERQILFDVLNERYEARRSTILLTNLSASECEHYLGRRVFDRMREDGGVMIVFNWESYRGKKCN